MKAHRDMDQISKSTDDVNEALADLRKRIESAESLEKCLDKGDCPLLDILEELSDSAKGQCVTVNPEDIIKVMQCQQTAKIFDAIVISIRNRLNAGEVAERELLEIDEENKYEET